VIGCFSFTKEISWVKDFRINKARNDVFRDLSDKIAKVESTGNTKKGGENSHINGQKRFIFIKNNLKGEKK
jgi:hypothetical protein